MDEQAKDRAHRIGQTSEVRVYRLISKTIVEEGILNRATGKKDLDAKIIQAGLFNQKASDQERNLRLQDLIRKDNKIDEDDEGDDIYTPEELNEIIARSDEEFELF